VYYPELAELVLVILKNVLCSTTDFMQSCGTYGNSAQIPLVAGTGLFLMTLSYLTFIPVIWRVYIC